MGTAAGEMNQGEHNEADELARDIERSRERMGETLEELHGRLNPGVLKEEVLQQFHEGKEALKTELATEYREAKAALATELHDIKEDAKTAVRDATVGKVEDMVQSTRQAVQGAGRSVVQSVKENPIPAVLIGAGLVWMVASTRRGGSAQGPGAQVGGSGPGGEGSIRQAAHSAKEAAVGAAHSAGEVLGNAAHTVQHSVGDAARQAGRQVSHLAHAAGSAGQDLGHRAQHTFVEHPLAVGAAVLVAGALVGLAIPISRKETQWFGSTQRELAERSGRIAERAGARLHEGVHQVAKQLEEKAERATHREGSSASS